MSAAARRATRAAAGAAAARGRVAHERAWVGLLLAAHVLLAVWGAVRQSVTFDENFHLPSGMLIASRGELRVSSVNPPLAKALAGAAALAAGARIPSDEALGRGDQAEVGFAFMRANADRYPRIFLAGRLVTVVFSVLLALAVWRWARRLWGPRGALVALAFYAFAPEALAHAGVVTMDVPTALGFVGSLLAWQAFVTAGRWRAWTATALSVAFTFLVRFSALVLPPLLLVLALAQLARRRMRHPRRVALGLALLPVTTLVALQVGYLGQTSWQPLRSFEFQSPAFQSLQKRLPGVTLPLPDVYLRGFDRQAVDSRPGNTPCFLLGQVRTDVPLAYYPVALAVKWPLGFWAALALLAVHGVIRRPRWRRLLWPLALVVVWLGLVVFASHLGVGIRYLFPIVPALAVLLGTLASRAPGDGAWWRHAAVALAAVQAIEAGAHAPWHLSFFNVLAGGPERAQWIVNDSNVDWGQGLIALREELARRGIRRVYLAYHGTAEPSVYGIDYVPYLGGPPGHASDWIAVSSFYFVGLSQRMTLPAGRTALPVRLDFKPLWSRTPDAMPAGCMLLFRLR